MSEPIQLNLPPHDPRETLYQRLENAPHEHVEALLAAYSVLQGLHDTGALECLKGALGSSERVLAILVDYVNSPEVIRGLRNGIILTKALGAIDPEIIEDLAWSLPDAIALTKTRVTKPPGLWQILKMCCSGDFRRAMFFSVAVVKAFGCHQKPGMPRGLADARSTSVEKA
jgi:uncharacterized protein YjgD (DUF1641 family)